MVKKVQVMKMLKNLLPESWQVLLSAFAASYGIGLLALLGLPFMFGATIDTFGLTESQAGLVGSAEFLAIMLASVLVAPFTATAPRRAIALVGSAIAITGNLLCIVDSSLSYESLVIYRSMAGVGCGFALAVGNATVCNVKDMQKMAAQMSVLFVALMAITMPLFSWVSATWGYQGIYAALALCSLVLTPLMLGLPRSANKNNTKQVSSTPISTFFSLPSALILMAAMIFAARDMAGWAFVERIGLEVGFSASDIGWLLSFQAVLGISGPLIASLVGSRFGLMMPVIFGILSSGIVYFAMLLFPESRQVYFTSAMFIGGTYFFALAYLTALAAEVDPKGRVVAAFGGFLSAGVAIGPFMGGILVEHYGYSGTSWVIFAMVMLTLIFAVLSINILGKKQSDSPYVDLENSTVKQVSSQ